MRKWWSKKNNTKTLTLKKEKEKLENDTINLIEKSGIEPKEDKYVTIEGYKGLCNDMSEKADGFTYKVGTVYMNVEKIFYFYLKLEDVYVTCPKNGINRFFKVKAKIKESDFDSNDIIFSTNQIKIIEEIKYDMKKARLEHHRETLDDLTMEEFDYMISIDGNLIDVINKRIKDLGYSEVFTQILKNKIKTCSKTNSIYDINRVEDMDIKLANELVLFGKGLNEENLSTEMKVCLFLEEIFRYNRRRKNERI